MFIYSLFWSNAYVSLFDHLPPLPHPQLQINVVEYTYRCQLFGTQGSVTPFFIPLSGPEQLEGKRGRLMVISNHSKIDQ